jgi:hypothetical protein
MLHLGTSPSIAASPVAVGGPRPASARTAAAMPPPAPTADATSSSSGVGGGLLSADECGFVRAHLALATLRLQLATADSGDGGVTPNASATSGSTGSVWAELRQSYLRAAAAARSAALGRNGGHAGSVWALSLLGVARTAWAGGDAVEAEAVLSEANVLDNQVQWVFLLAQLENRPCL